VEEASSLVCGSALHKVWADWFRGKLPTPAHGLKMFADEYESWSQHNCQPDDKRRIENVYPIIHTWLEQHPPEKFPFIFHPDLIEKQIIVPFGDGFEYEAVIDALVQEKTTGAWYVLDHKSTGMIGDWFVKQFFLDSQTTGYQVTASREFNRPVGGTFINAMEIKELPADPTKKCKVHNTTYKECGRFHAKAELIGPITRSDELLKEWEYGANQLSHKLQDLMKYDKLEYVGQVQMQGLWTGACSDYGGCEYRQFCLGGRKPELGRRLLVPQPPRGEV
jgi:hypothetical protein